MMRFLSLGPGPSIARNAPDKPLTIAVDFDERFLALVANNIRHDAPHSLTAALAACRW
jgi:hypothetical protein